MKKMSAAQIVAHIVLICMVVVTLFPYMWTFLAATHTNAQVFNLDYTFKLGSNMIQNYYDLLDAIPIWKNLFSSLFIALIYTALVLLIDSMAGYGFAMFEFKGRNLLFIIVLAMMMIPVQVLMVPLYIQFSKIGLVDSWWGVILSGLPGSFGVFLMRQSMLSFPRDLIEAARIDGAGEIRIFFTIVLPNMRSSITSLGIISFVNQWGNYYVPLVLINSSDKYTVPVAMALLSQPNFDINYGALMLGACMAVLPIIVFFLVFQKNFINGMMVGAVKG